MHRIAIILAAIFLVPVAASAQSGILSTTLAMRNPRADSASFDWLVALSAADTAGLSRTALTFAVEREDGQHYVGEEIQSTLGRRHLELGLRLADWPDDNYHITSLWFARKKLYGVIGLGAGYTWTQRWFDEGDIFARMSIEYGRTLGEHGRIDVSGILEQGISGYSLTFGAFAPLLIDRIAIGPSVNIEHMVHDGMTASRYRMELKLAMGI